MIIEGMLQLQQQTQQLFVHAEKIEKRLESC